MKLIDLVDTKVLEVVFTFHITTKFNIHSRWVNSSIAKFDNKLIVIDGDEVGRKSIAELNPDMMDRIVFSYGTGIEVGAKLTFYTLGDDQDALDDMYDSFHDKVSSHIKSIIFKLGNAL